VVTGYVICTVGSGVRYMARGRGRSRRPCMHSRAGAQPFHSSIRSFAVEGEATAARRETQLISDERRPAIPAESRQKAHQPEGGESTSQQNSVAHAQHRPLRHASEGMAVQWQATRATRLLLAEIQREEGSRRDMYAPCVKQAVALRRAEGVRPARCLPQTVPSRRPFRAPRRCK